MLYVDWLNDIDDCQAIFHQITEGHRAFPFINKLVKIAKRYGTHVTYAKVLRGFESSRGLFAVDANQIQLQLYCAENSVAGDPIKPSHIRINTAITLAHELGHAAAAFRCTPEERVAIGDRRERFNKNKRGASYQDLLDIVIEEADAWIEGRAFLEEIGFTEWALFYKIAHRCLGTYMTYLERIEIARPFDLAISSPAAAR